MYCSSLSPSSSDSSTAIQDMVAHVHGPTLFFTAGSAIQIWNLRMLVIANGYSTSAIYGIG